MMSDDNALLAMPDAYPSSAAAAAAAAAAQAPPPRRPGSSAATHQHQQQRVLFSCCKGETHTHRSGFKQLYRRLRAAGYRTGKLESVDDLAAELAAAAAATEGGSRPQQQQHQQQPHQPTPIVVLGCPTAPFTKAECDALAALLAAGGGLLVMLRDGGERAAGTNLNYLLERYGVAAAKDAVLRAAYDTYPHPREARVVDGVVNRALLLPLGPLAPPPPGGQGFTTTDVGSSGSIGSSGAVSSAHPGGGGGPEVGKPGMGALPFVYPYGCSLNVQRPAVPLLSSGRVCYPVQRPLMAAWEGAARGGGGGGGGGRLLVIGTARMFGDEWLGREANARIADWAFAWLRQGSRAAPLHAGDAAAPDIAEPRLLPDVEALADRPKPCLYEAARALPRDWTRLFDRARAGAQRTALVPEAAALHARLGVPSTPLALIPPELDAPLPPLAAAVLPCAPRCPAPPPLELFDLDEALAPPAARLAAAFQQAVDDIEAASAAAAAAASNKTRGRRPPFEEASAAHSDEGADSGSGSGSSGSGAAPELEAFLLDAAAVCGLEAPERTGKGVLSALLREMLGYRSSTAAAAGAVGFGGGVDEAGAAAALAAPRDDDSHF